MASFQANNYQDAFTRLNGETAKIPWRSLAPWFAKGETLSVDATLDLVDVAASFAIDDSSKVKPWLETGNVRPVSVEDAAQWHEKDAELWAVVVLPWILVQDKTPS